MEEENLTTTMERREIRVGRLHYQPTLPVPSHPSRPPKVARQPNLTDALGVLRNSIGARQLSLAAHAFTRRKDLEMHSFFFTTTRYRRLFKTHTHPSTRKDRARSPSRSTRPSKSCVRLHRWPATAHIAPSSSSGYVATMRTPLQAAACLHRTHFSAEHVSWS